MTVEPVTTIDNNSLVLKNDVNYQNVNAVWREGELFFSNLSAEKAVVDLKNLTTVNSVTLALLVEWQRVAKKHCKKIGFRHLSSQLMKAIEANNLKSVINIE